MSHVLKVPFPKFRDHLMQAMKNNMTTMKEWSKHPVKYDELAARLIDEFKIEWNDLKLTKPDQVLKDKAKELFDRYTTEEWLQMPGRKFRNRKIKIAEGLMLMEQTIGPDIQAVVLVRDGIVEDLNIYGRQDLAIRFIGREWREDLLVGLSVNPVNNQEESIHAS
jgi:hypothetical protein